MGPLWGGLLVPGEVSVAGEELVVWSVCPKVERTYSLNLLYGWTHPGLSDFRTAPAWMSPEHFFTYP